MNNTESAYWAVVFRDTKAIKSRHPSFDSAQAWCPANCYVQQFEKALLALDVDMLRPCPKCIGTGFIDGFERESIRCPACSEGTLDRTYPYVSGPTNSIYRVMLSENFTFSVRAANHAEALAIARQRALEMV